MNNPLLQKASIVLSPSAYGTSTLNSIKPAFRVSDTELVTNGSFSTDSNWTKGTGWTISGGVASRTAQSGSTACDQSISLTAGRRYQIVYTLTISAGSFNVRFSGTTNVNGASRTTSGTYTDFLVAATGNNTLRLVGADGSFVGSVDNVSVREITDADFDFTRSSTATRVNESDLIETVAANTARIDFTSGVGNILLEPSRTNLFPYSNDYTQSDWSKSNVTITQNAGISPENINNASKMIVSSNASFAYIHDALSGSSSKYSISAFAKADGRSIVWLYINSSSTNGTIYYDLSDGTLQAVAGGSGTPTGTITAFPNNWYKITYTSPTAFTLGSGSGIGVSDAKGSTAATIDGTNGVLIYGLQIEAGSYATSLIHTSGSAVTRSADAANNAANSDLINSPEGVLYLEVAFVEQGGHSISISDKTSDNRVTFSNSSSTNRFKARVRLGGTNVFNIHAAAIDNTLNFNKYAIKWKANDFALWCNGTERNTVTSGSSFSAGTLTTVSFDKGDGSNDFEGKFKVLAVFKEALTDAELTTLTS